jgi:hypothetical protein
MIPRTMDRPRLSSAASRLAAISPARGNGWHRWIAAGSRGGELTGSDVKFISSGGYDRSRMSASKIILFGDRSLRRAISEYVTHYHTKRNHQGNVLLFPRDTEMRGARPVHCRERLGGLLRYYHNEAA